MAKLNDILKGPEKKTGVKTFPVQMIHYSKLVPSEHNKYEVSGIEELASNIILAGGVKQNLLARKAAPDTYTILAGHRRHAAVKYLVEDRGLEEFAMIPVKVENCEDIISRLNLILTNSNTRTLTDAERMMEVSEMYELLEALMAEGDNQKDVIKLMTGLDPEEIGGRELRRIVAEKLGMSQTKVANLRNIERNLEPELKEKFKSGEIGVSVANEAAGLPVEQQRELAGKEDVKLAEVKAMKSVSESDTGKNTEIPYYEIPGQMQITDFPGVVQEEISKQAAEPYMVRPEDLLQDPAEENKAAGAEKTVSESDTEPKSVLRKCIKNLSPYGFCVCCGYDGVRCCAECNLDCNGRCGWIEKESSAAKMQQNEEMCCENSGGELSAYGTQTRTYPADSLIATAGCEGGHDCFSCSLECGIRKEDRWCVEAPCGNPFPCEILPNLEEIREHVRDTCEFVNHDLACHRAGDGEPDPCCKHCKEPCEYICGRAMKALDTGEEPPEKSVTVEDRGLDLEEPATSDRDLLRGMLEKERQFLEEMIKVDQTDPLPNNMVRKEKLLVGALAGMLCDLESVEEEEIEQPELPILKNNDQRKAWLKKYKEWPVWFEVPQASEVYYRYDFQDGQSFVICEYHYYLKYLKEYGQDPEKIGTREYALKPGYHYLEDCKTSITDMIDKLKEMQKK